MAYRYTRMPTLLRYGPYVDLAKLRAALIKRCTEILEKYPNHKDAYGDWFQKFIDGDVSCLPNAAQFKLAIRDALSEHYRDYADDIQRGSLRAELERYFLWREYWVTDHNEEE